MALLQLLLEYYGTVFVLGVILLVLMWSRQVCSNLQVFHRLDIPGPPPKFLLGNALDFSKTFPLELYSKWFKKYGPIFGYYEGMKPSLVVTCPKMAHEILVKKFKCFSSRPQHTPFLWELEERSLQHSNGLLWKRQRQAVSGGMSGKCIREMFPIINQVTDELLEEIEKTTQKETEGFYIDDLIERYTVDIMSEAALGYPSNAIKDKNSIFLRYMQAAHESGSPESFASGLARLFPQLTRVLKPLDKKHKLWASRMRKEVENFVYTAKDNPYSACPIMRSMCLHASFRPGYFTEQETHKDGLTNNMTSSNSSDSKKSSTLGSEGNKASNSSTYTDLNGCINITANTNANTTSSRNKSKNVHQKNASSENHGLCGEKVENKVITNGTVQKTDGIPCTNERTRLKFTYQTHSHPNGNGYLESTSQLGSDKNSRKSPGWEKNDGVVFEEEMYKQRRLTADLVEKKKSGTLTEEEVIGEIMGLLAAGLGPLSAAITFVIYCLVVHKDERSKVEDEIHSVMGEKKHITMDELKKMDALERFIFESIRTYPVAPGVSRECVEECVISGHRFTQGMVVRVMSNVMYKNELNFEHPHKFMPERFKDKGFNSAWMPFGQGPRKCVADRLALSVLKLCTARILQSFKLSAAPKTQVPLQLALRPFLVPKDGVCLRFQKKSSAL